MAFEATISGEELVARMARRDEEALSLLYDRYQRLLFSLAHRIVRDRAEAEEVLGDVFFQAWRSAATFDPGRGSVTAWLVTLCRARSIDRFRRQARRQEGLAGLAAEPSPAAVAPAAARESSDSLESEDRRLRITAALGDLSAEQRGVLELAYFGGLSHSEIASRLGQPLGTVKTRIRQALIQLRETLGGPS